MSEGSVTIQSDNSFQIAAADDGFYQNPVDLAEYEECRPGLYSRSARATSYLYQYPRLTLNPFSADPINLVILSGYNDDSG